MDHCSPSIAKIKELFSDKSELPVSEILTSLSIESLPELEKIITDSRIYELSKDQTTVSKKSIIRFKMIILKSESEIPLPISHFVTPIIAIFSNIPYIRFNKTIGQVILFEDDFKQVEDVYTKDISVQSPDGPETFKVTFNESTFDDRRAFSNEHSKHMEGILRYKYGKHTHFAVDGITVYRNGIYLGPQKFKSIKELQSFFGKLLKAETVDKAIGEAEAGCLKELLKYHVTSEKKMEDFDHFEVGLHPKFGETKCFLIVKKDGTKEDFSYNKCIKQISSLIN